jgi:hypothetical protein
MAFVPKTEAAGASVARGRILTLHSPLAREWVTDGYLRFVGWVVLVVFGQVSALQLIDAGPTLHFQHYRPLTQGQPLFVAMLLVETICVSVGILNRRAQIWAWLRDTFRAWQLAAIGTIFVVSSAALSRDAMAYAIELPLAVAVQLVNVGAIILLAWSIPPRLVSWFERLGEQILGANTAPRHIDRLVVWSALAVTLTAGVLNILAYQRAPHIPDEVIYVLQARYLAAGMLTMPSPPVPAAFDVDLMTYEPTRWFSPVQPGWPAVLAIGARLNVVWLVNPVLAGVNVILTFILLREIYDRRTARLAVLLLAVSPWNVFMGMNFMTHTLTLTTGLAAAVLLIVAQRTDRARWALLAGGILGFGALVRQLDGLIAAMVLGIWCLGLGGRRPHWRSTVALTIGTIAVAAFWLPYNQLLSGDPRVFPLEAYIDQHYGVGSNALGFGPNRGQGWALQAFPGHTPLNAAVNTVLNAFSLNIELFGWATGSLILIACLVFSGAMRRRDYGMLAAGLAVVGAYSLYWYHGGPDFGPRYWFQILIPCVALGARAIQFLCSRIAETAGPQHAARVTGAVVALSACAVLTYIPWRAVDKYYHYELMQPELPSLADADHFGRSLVLVRGERHPDYASAASQNPLDLDEDAPIYAWDRDPATRQQVVQTYSDRPIWIVDGPSLTHGDYHVVAGPISADELFSRAVQDQ